MPGRVNMGEIRIVEYDKKLAKGIADMWNRSAESWGGQSAPRTEESIIREHENATFLNVFIAMDGDEVVGYCSFSEYQTDEGALFIPLLNVRPDYHGRKIGKALVMKAVERTVELGWPRLDLYTWAGNTKAVPLYKKCGFFWEERDDSTHLMNFIPTVLKTEAFEEFFRHAHWYDDSRRKIEVKPDGIKESGFTYFEYLWKKDGRNLRVQFEKTGRGMRLAETDDYLIYTSIERHDLVFGMSYRIKYHLENKSGAPLEVCIRGKDDKNIKYDFETCVNVDGVTEIEGEFSVGETEKEQDTWQTHPAVVSEIRVNGKAMTFKTGIEVKFPALMCITALPVERYPDVEHECFIEIENNFKKSAVFEFTLPEDEFIEFEQTRFEIGLEAEGKKSIPVKYRLRDYGVYHKSVPVVARVEGGATVCFNRLVSHFFRGNRGRFTWEGVHSWLMANGFYMATLSKTNNNVYVSCLAPGGGISFPMPKLGRPYSNEFNRKKPDKVEFDYGDSGDDSVTMKAHYTSGEFRGIELVRIMTLYPNGIFTQKCEVRNSLDEEADREIYLDVNVYFYPEYAVIPYEGRYIELNEENEEDLHYWDYRKISENWIFARNRELPRGICWPKSAGMKIESYSLSFEKCFGRMKANSSAESDTITLSLGTYRKWQDFRAFALGEHTTEYLPTHESTELTVNNGNPFVAGAFEIVAEERKNKSFAGEIRIESAKGVFEETGRSFEKEDGITRAVFTVPAAPAGYDTIKCTFDLEDQVYSVRKGIFGYGSGTVKFERSDSCGMAVVAADNGLIKIAASADYSYGIFSLQYKGEEWLESGFPEKGPRYWWNPFFGGIITQPSNMNNISLSREKISADAVHLEDNHGNAWSGLKISVEVREHKQNKGLVYHQYFLMLPDLPVLCHAVEVVQNTGRFMGFEKIYTECFFKPAGDIRNSWIMAEDENGNVRKYKAGKVPGGAWGKDAVSVGSAERNSIVQIYANKEISSVGASVNVNFVSASVSNSIVLRNGESQFLNPFFLIFGDSFIDARELKDLRNIRFGTCRK